MRIVLLAVFVSVLAACGQPPASDTPAAPAGTEPQTPLPPATPSAAVDGWEIDMTAYGQIGSALPPFTARLADGGDVTTETLRGHWTIFGVWPDGGAPAEEVNFASALNSAVDQDPELNLLIVERAKVDGAGPSPHPWPTLVDDGSVASAIAAPSTPAYLLIGPDLTIEGYRGALTTTPDDGIKSVIRGVAEIRKQIAAPQ